MISSDKISEVVRKIATKYQPEKIIMFGSFANGNQNENSDLDLVIIKESELSRPERTIQVRKLIYGSKIPIDLIVFTPDEIIEYQKSNNRFIINVLTNGKILYQRAQ